MSHYQHLPLTERPLTLAEAANWTCPRGACGQDATTGTLTWRDHGPGQLISRHTLTCPAGHTWHHETDGG
ncbi:hypothetical protein ACWCXH_14400 [Kitasatospora sp. NPDC001660]